MASFQVTASFFSERPNRSREASLCTDSLTNPAPRVPYCCSPPAVVHVCNKQSSLFTTHSCLFLCRNPTCGIHTGTRKHVKTSKKRNFRVLSFTQNYSYTCIQIRWFMDKIFQSKSPEVIQGKQDETGAALNTRLLSYFLEIPRTLRPRDQAFKIVSTKRHRTSETETIQD